jgi:hypothetical protein
VQVNPLFSPGFVARREPPVGQALSPANPYRGVPRNESVGQASRPVIPALLRAAAESW